MVASNLKRLSRMELLYTCLSNFVIYLHKNGYDDKLKGLEQYYGPNDMNVVIYYKKSNPEDDCINTILNDANQLLKSCEGEFDEVKPVSAPHPRKKGTDDSYRRRQPSFKDQIRRRDGFESPSEPC